MFRKWISLATIFSLGAILFPFASVGAQDAGIYLSPAQATIAVGQEITVKVWEKTGQTNIDTIRANIRFPADLLRVEGIKPSDSFPVSSGGNYFDNSNGDISWGQGVYNGTMGNATVFEIVFSALKQGKAVVRLAAGTKMISNGLDVSFITSDATYDIIESGIISLPLPIDNTPAVKKPTITNDFGFVEKAQETQAMMVGQANIPGAIVYILFDNGLFTGTVIAGETGDWSWRLPDDINAGRYEVTIVAADPKNIANRVSRKTSILLAGEQSSIVPLQMSVSVGRPYEIIHACNQVDANIILSGKPEQLNVGDQLFFDYKIYDPSNKIILRQQDARVYDGEPADFWKSITLSDDSAVGDYRFVVEAAYGPGKFVSSESGFYVCGASDVARQLNFYVIGAIAGACLVLAAIVWIMRRRKKIVIRRKNY